MSFSSVAASLDSRSCNCFCVCGGTDDDFGSEAEAVGYSRRMADEMLGLASQLSLDFDYSNVALYDGDLLEEDLDPDHPALIGVWVLDEDGCAYVPADEFREADPA